MADTYQVIITEPAQKDLENIINYIGEEKGSVQGAAFADLNNTPSVTMKTGQHAQQA